VLRLLDAETGSYAQVRPIRPGVLRVCAHVPATAGPSDLTGVRVLLVADLLTRAAELRRLQVLTALTSDGETPHAVEAAAGTLGIHPPVARATPEEAETALGGPIDVHLIADKTVPANTGLVARVGAAQGSLAADPLALRFALLSVPWSEPVDVTAAAQAAAQDTLKDWRRRVAEWARSPSGPIPPRLADKVRTALDDLDTVSALALLRGLAADDTDDTVSPGTRFETFVYVDRLLGLELPRDIGKDP
jgi:hypothetical protein